MSLLAQSRLDYLQVALDYGNRARLKDCLDMVSARLGDKIELNWTRPKVRGHDWDASGCSPLGVAVAATHSDRRQHGARLWLSIPGKPLGQLTLANQLRLLSILRNTYRADVTRVDVTCDLPREWKTLKQAESAMMAGDFAGCSYVERITSRKRGETATTLYFGAPGGDRRLVVYDKERESKGRLPFDRWELRLNDLKAAAWTDTILASYEDDEQSAAEYIARCATDWIKFRWKDSATRMARAKECTWFAELKDRLGREILPCVGRVIKTVDNTIAWLKKQVIPTLKMLESAVGSYRLTHIMRECLRDLPTTLSREKALIMERWREEVDAMPEYNIGHLRSLAYAS
jgi:DNA relaxase NicK